VYKKNQLGEKNNSKQFPRICYLEKYIYIYIYKMKFWGFLCSLMFW
jgi:hypothetical protein